MITALGMTTLITGDIAKDTVVMTMNVLSGTLRYMTTNSEDLIIKKYKEELEAIDIEFKLNIVKEWLDNSEQRHEKLYEGIVELCKSLTSQLEGIDKKIKDHKSRWFHSWRTLDLLDEINFIKRKCLILNERILLITCIQHDKNSR